MIINDSLLRAQARLGMVRPFIEANVQGSSIDLTLGSELKVENELGTEGTWADVDISGPDGGYYLEPGEFILAHTAEVITIPPDCGAMVLLRSSAARAGFEHSLAGWCDPGFSGQITLELRNNLRHHSLLVEPGMRICQLVVHQLKQPATQQYGERGSYQGQQGATASTYNFSREAA